MDTLTLKAIYGLDTFQGRRGAPKISRWKGAGLLKPSVLGPEFLEVDRRDATSKLGTLAEEDRHLLGPGSAPWVS